MQPFKLALLFILVVLGLSVAYPLIGSGGRAAYFKAADLDIIGGQWFSTITTEFTVEYWVYILDTNQDESLTFSYSAYIPEQNAERPDEFHIRILPTGLRFAKGVESFQCLVSSVPDCGGWYSSNTWNHLAASWKNYGSYATITLYKNGQQIYITNQTGSTWVENFNTAGCLHFSQDADSLCGGFDTTQALDGVVDSVRVWTVERTPTQIQDNYQIAAENLPHPGGDLDMGWIFESSTDIVPDIEGASQTDGQFGHLPLLKNLATMADASAPRVPGKPTHVYSFAPIVGSGELYVWIDPNAGDATITIPAWALPTDTITYTLETGPSNGTVKNIDTSATISEGGIITDSATTTSNRTIRVIYSPSSPANWVSDVIGVLMDDGARPADVVVRIFQTSTEVESPSPLTEFTIDEDTFVMLTLAGLSPMGQKYGVQITQLPLNGHIYQAGFLVSPPTYLQPQTDRSQLTMISSVPGNATDPNGALQYFPNVDASSYNSSVVFDSFRFKWYDKTTGIASPNEGLVNIYVTAVNDPPVAQDLTITVTDTNPIMIQLNSTDVDTNFSPHPFYTIKTWPMAGTLLQAASDGSTVVAGDVLVQRDRLPTLQALPAKVLNASSQYTRCPAIDNCNSFLGCINCTVTEFHAVRVLEIDVYPLTADAAGAWEAVVPPADVEFIEIEFDDEVYTTQVNIYEVFNPGVIDYIGVASEYNGTDTQWSLVWSSPIPGGQLNIDNVARIFSPSLCPVNVKGKYMRVSGHYGYRAGYHGIDAIQHIGVTELPVGKVSDDAGRVYYVPPPGVYSTDSSSYDQFTYVATDCEDASLVPAVVKIQLPLLSSAPAGEYYSIANQSVIPGQVTAFTLPLADIITNLMIKTGDTSLSVANVSIHVRSTTADNVNFGQYNPSNTVNDISVPFDVTDSQGRILMDVDSEQGPFSMDYVVNVMGFSYVMSAVFSLDCPDNQYPSSSGPCVPCQDISSDQINNMANDERAYFESVCLLDYSFSAGIRIAFLAVACLGLAGIVACAIAIVIYREHSVIKASSPHFALLILLGGAMALAVIPFAYPTNPVTGWCVVQPWLGNLGFGLVYASLFAKTYRLARIFNNPKLRARVIPNLELFRMVAIICGVIIAYLIVWSAVDTPQPTLVKNVNVEYYVCQSKQIFWMPALLALEGLLLIWGIYLCIKVRNTPSAFNESKWIAFCLYNMIIISVIVIALVYAFNLNPDIVYLFTSLGLIIGACGTIGLLYIPKFHGIYSNVVLESSNFKRTNSIIGSFPVNNSSEMSNVSSDEMDKLKSQRNDLAKRNAELEQKIRKLESQISEYKSRNGKEDDSDGNDTGSDTESASKSGKNGETVVMLRDQSKPALNKYTDDSDDDSDSDSDSDRDQRMSKKASGRLDIAKKKDDDIKRTGSKDDIPVTKSSSKTSGLNKSPSKGADMAKSPSKAGDAHKSSSKSAAKPAQPEDTSSSEDAPVAKPDVSEVSEASSAAAAAPKKKKKTGAKKSGKKSGAKKSGKKTKPKE